MKGYGDKVRIFNRKTLWLNTFKAVNPSRHVDRSTDMEKEALIILRHLGAATLPDNRLFTPYITLPITSCL